MNLILRSRPQNQLFGKISVRDIGLRRENAAKSCNSVAFNPLHQPQDHRSANRLAHPPRQPASPSTATHYSGKERGQKAAENLKIDEDFP